MSNMSEDTAEEILQKRTSKSWISERVALLFQSHGFDEALEEGIELIRKRRVLDFVVVGGSFGARVFGEEGPPTRIDIKIPQLSSEEWSRVFGVLAEKSFYLAKLLAGELPEETVRAFAKAECELLPQEGIEFFADDQRVSTLESESAAIIYRFCDKLVSDPFLLFTLRGRGREETILELRKRRANIKVEPKIEELSTEEPVEIEPVKTSLSDYWQYPSELNDVQYNIKADELPAAILKWLDPPPLNELEIEVEGRLEEAYEMIARRAQAYGLGLIL